MELPDESEELELKKRARRRLVGAIALVLIVIFLVPLLLDNEPREFTEDVQINIEGESEATVSVDSESNSSPQERSIESLQPDDRSSIEVSESRGAASGASYAVQIGAYSNKEYASMLIKKLKANKFEVITDEIERSDKLLTRIRVGPFSSKNAARNAKQLVEKRLALEKTEVIEL